MIFKAQCKYETDESRKRLAERLSLMIQGEVVRGLPYSPMDSTDYFVLDLHNDWFLNFDLLKPAEFSIRYRYNSDVNDKENAFATWLMVRMPALTRKD